MIEQMLIQLNDQVSRLAKHNSDLISENELMKANLRIVAEGLRSGVSKIQQKTMARVIEEMLRSEK